MVKYAMVIDITRCNGCYNCQLACKDEHVENDFPPIALAQPDMGHFWMKVKERERGQYPRVKMAYIPIPCQHCEDAPCMKAATGGAIYSRPDGIVIIDPEKARGQKALVDSCPYGVIYWNEQLNLPQKCTFCAHLLDDGWREPRCVESCPTEALVFGDLDDPESPAAKKLREAKTEELRPELVTTPRVLYVGLPRLFLAAAVIYSDTDECAEGVTVTLTTPEGKTLKTATDNYGDFEFEGLNPGNYTVKLETPGYATETLTVNLQTDRYLGDITLNKT